MGSQSVVRTCVHMSPYGAIVPYLKTLTQTLKTDFPLHLLTGPWQDRLTDFSSLANRTWTLPCLSQTGAGWCSDFAR